MFVCLSQSLVVISEQKLAMQYNDALSYNQPSFAFTFRISFLLIEVVDDICVFSAKFLAQGVLIPCVLSIGSRISVLKHKFANDASLPNITHFVNCLMLPVLTLT